MKYFTVGKIHNPNKIAPIACIKNDSLQHVAIQNECFLLVLLTKGTLEFSVNGQSYVAASPCFICFSEKENPRFAKPPATVCSTVYFHPRFLNCNMNFELLRDVQYDDIAANHDLFLLKPFVDGPRIIPIVETTLDGIISAFDGVRKELEEQRDWYWSCRSRSYFMELMIALERMYGRLSYGETTQAPNVSIEARDERLKAALIVMESQYASSLTLADLTAAIGVNRVTLSKLFKQECGMTFAEYLKHYRLTVAQKHLLFTELPIKEIALRCGFKTVPHFSRCIKDKTGMTPLQYRRNEVMRRKATLQQDVVPVMDVVLDELTGNQMYYTAREHFPRIVKIGFWFGQGDLQARGTKKRWAFFDEIDPRNEVAVLESEYHRNVDRLCQHAEKRFPIRIWRTRSITHHVCTFAYLCDRLQQYDCPIDVIDSPDNIESWGLLGTEETPFKDYLSLAKLLTKDETAHYVAEWKRLCDENTTLRVLENGNVRSVGIDYLDDRLLPFLPTPESGIAVIDELVARSFDFEYFEWYRYRIREFIKNGPLEYVPLEGVEYSNIIRHKDAPKTLSIDDLRLIGNANLSTFPNDKPDYLPEAQVWVLLSKKGTVYVIQNDDSERLIRLLTQNDDTQIAIWITIWWRNRTLDVPSYTARTALLELNVANVDTAIPLQSVGRIEEKRLGDTLPNKT